jgi:hypothetical protein
MANVATAFINQEVDRNRRVSWVGECDAILIYTSCPELEDQPVEFRADSREELLAAMVTVLKARGISGVLRVSKS